MTSFSDVARDDPAAVPHEIPESTAVTLDRGYRPIADYAMVGDAQSAALVASEGSVDWLCLPHFDSPAVLCRILDADRGGFLSITADVEPVRTLRAYREASNVLDTTFELDGGTLTITDAMPIAVGDPTPPLDGVWGGRGRHRLVRIMTADGVAIDIVLTARIAFDFAATAANLVFVPGEGVIVDDGADRYLALVWPGSLAVDDSGALHGRLRLEPGESAACVLGYARDRDDAARILAKSNWQEQVDETDAAWRRWASRCRVEGPFAAEILRSALTLKMLTFEPTGAVIAAPTTSLPEDIGGVRNWDYRYCWLRDATFTLYALLLAGDRTAAAAFWQWIERTCAPLGAERMQIMYGIHGERELPERTLDHLSGYRDSAPVRVGNAAADQRQLDIYGELLDAFWFFLHQGGDEDPPPIDPGVWALMRNVADHICDVWREPDQGLWEVRSGPRHFVYSKVMCWVGLDRAIRLVELCDLDCDRDRWISERDAIYREVVDRGFDPVLNSFTMAYDSVDLDAALLRLPLVGFLPATDPRIVGTIERIQAELQANGLVHRYEAEDGLAGGEGAFSICTFWLVDCLTAIGRIDEARALFEQMLGYASDLGLFAEEVDPRTGAALGNYPQAFTHLALIDAGVDLTEAILRHSAVVGETADRANQVRTGRSDRGSNAGA